MNIFSNKKRSARAANERVAQVVAELVLKSQARLATAFAKKFNTYSPRKKKMIFLAVTVFTAVFLLSGLFFNYDTIPALKQTYQPATHIGRASDVNQKRNSN